MTTDALPRPVIVLGLSGIVPQALCLGGALISSDWHWIALAAGCFYAALILSFLGGMWWMQALERSALDWGPYILAVIPSLAGWAALLPWCLGWIWPAPSLFVLALLLAASPLVDRTLARRFAASPAWLALRWRMAMGLGALTLALGLS
ncbi:DUF3429 domain-containing protein [Novosphingobium malaysiense]|uniref:DUF3429 domain-containing protein n=1 Tax=Novosphingobium malaysiense TaxID=1348853 RepID=A0A0B1ZK26_9SPHN|nr:DUF3429 domain-containing protein [Novosphingobium malaysiense]KHK91475.1 hypothetical protein LK12_11635 [Novosphingobium malaysiense]